MSDENEGLTGPPPEEAGDDDAGEPIQELKDLERDTSPGFLARVWRKIQRRTAVSHVATFSWRMPGVVLFELVGMLVHVLNALSTRKGSER
ncbi:MAG TPA: hypothetical protein VGL72_31405 [Bryobacteraceae bacterium]|jgi:hypothetical protein